MDKSVEKRLINLLNCILLRFYLHLSTFLSLLINIIMLVNMLFIISMIQMS